MTSSKRTPNREFQSIHLPFANKRRQKFLESRKLDRESLFKKVQKLAHDAHQSVDECKADNEPKAQDIDIKSFDFSFNSNKNNSSNELQNGMKSTKNRNWFQRKQENRKKYVKQFMIHEWMIDIPKDLTQNWLVGLRPEGDRCLVYACDGHTVSRNRRGIFIHEYFPSLLPAGNAFDCKKKLVTILDCIWIQARKTYFVMDCLCWENRLICLSDAAMRLWFIAGKFKECAAIHQISIKRNRYRFQCIQTFNVTSDNLSFLYSGGSLINEQQKKKNLKKNQQEINPRNSNLYIGVDIHYRRMKGKNKRRWKKSNKKNKKQKSQESMDVCPMSIDINIQKPKVNVNRKVMNLRPDGFIFYHKRGMYVEGRSCPLILIWKDCRISPYFIETQNKHKSDINSNNNCNQMLKNDMCGSILAALKVNADGNVTAYEEDIILGNICYDNCGLDAVLMKQRNIQPNDLLKFLVLNASILNIAADEGKDIGNYCNVERLQFVRKCASTKMNADVFSKIVFQSQAQNGKCITFEEMMRFVSNENVKNVNNAGLLPRTDEEWEREGANVDSLLSIHTLGL